jgi:hypothetical protein
VRARRLDGHRERQAEDLDRDAALRAGRASASPSRPSGSNRSSTSAHSVFSSSIIDAMPEMLPGVGARFYGTEVIR